MRLGSLLDNAGIKYPTEVENIYVKNIVTDSRQVSRDSMFVCIKGLTNDGHEHIGEALRKGASVIVAERVRDECVGGAAAFITHDNTRKASALLYNAFYQRPTDKLKIVGVTGTNGKTSVATMLYHIFKEAGYRTGLIGTVCRLTADGRSLSPKKKLSSANMTTPDPDELYRDLAKMAKDKVEYVFMEVSSHALALSRTEPITFDSGVFTNLTRDHLDFHGSMEEYFKSKKLLFEKCNKAFVFADTEYGKILAAETPCPTFTCSVSDGDFCALDIKYRGMAGVAYRLKAPKEDIEISLPLIGSFATENSLMASAVAIESGIDGQTVKKALEGFKGVSGRMERISRDGVTVIIDYAHTPDALEKLLLSVRSLMRSDARLILVFGCGGERDKGKRSKMGKIASENADLVIVSSDNSRGEDTKKIIDGILEGIDKEKPYRVIEKRKEAIECAVAIADEGDVVVLAGKGHEKYEIDGEGAHSFDERKIVRAALRRRP